MREAADGPHGSDAQVTRLGLSPRSDTPIKGILVAYAVTPLSSDSTAMRDTPAGSADYLVRGGGPGPMAHGPTADDTTSCMAEGRAPDSSPQTRASTG